MRGNFLNNLGKNEPLRREGPLFSRKFLSPIPAWLLLIFSVSAPHHVEAQEADGPVEVTVGMYVNDIQLIELRTHSYVVDFYLWFRWKDPEFDPADSCEFMNQFEPKRHIETRIYEKPKVQPDGSFYQCVRRQGQFSTKFHVENYPFDQQQLTIVLEDNEKSSSELQYRADTDPVTLNQDIRLPGYKIGKPRLVVSDYSHATAFGDLSMPDASAYSRATFSIPVTRPIRSGVLKTLVPILLVTLPATLALLLASEFVQARVGLAITAMLSLVAMQFTMLNALPEVAYLTLVDRIFLASYAYIIGIIAIMVEGSRHKARMGDTNILSPPKTRPLISTGLTVVYAIVITWIVVDSFLG